MRASFLVFSLAFIKLIFAGGVYAQDRPLRLGVILPLTGKSATVGVAVHNGMLLAHEGLPERVRKRFTLQFEDDASETRQSVAAARRLIGEGRVDAVCTAMSNTGNAVVPLTEQRQIALISLAYDRSISDGKKFAVSFWVDVNDIARAAVAEAQRRGYRRVAIVSSIHEGNIAMREALVRANQGRIEFPLVEEIQPLEVDLATHALRVKNTVKIDAVVTLLHPNHVGLFARVLRINGVAQPLFTLGNFEDRSARLDAAGALQGQWYAAVRYAPWFLPAYRRRFPQDSTYGAAFGHDAVLLLARAVEQSVARAQLAEFLRSAPLRGGAIPGVTPDGRNGFRFPLEIKVVGEDGID